MWSLESRYTAGGAEWRRVQSWNRPSLWLELHHLQAPAKSWTDLEKLNFWNLTTDEKEDDWDFKTPSGDFSAYFYLTHGKENQETLPIPEFIWRVAARDGRWFTVELAALVGENKSFEQLTSQETLSTAKGKDEDSPTLDPDYWKSITDLYFLENIPFGTVTVRAPRNARDVESYALARAQQLIGGLPAPQHIEVDDFSKWETEVSETTKDDIFVQLHFNGFYED
jgi:hypothetical protein